MQVEEAALRTSGYQSLLKETVMVPFLELEKMPLHVLKAVSNYLRTEVATLEHNIHFMLGQYHFSYKKLEEANRIRLSKLALEGAAMDDDKPADPTAEATTGGSPPSA